MVRVFQWNDQLWYGTVAGKKVAGPQPSLGKVVTECERLGRRKVKQTAPPPSWFKGEAGPNKNPQPFRKAMSVAAGAAGTIAKVAAVVGRPGVSAVAGSVAKVAEMLADLSVPKLAKAVRDLDGSNVDKVLEMLEGLEVEGKNRKGVHKAIGVRRRRLKRVGA